MSEENHIEKIGQIIQDLSADASFTGEAMRQFLELKTEVDSQESTIKYLRREWAESKEAVKARDGHIKNLEQTIDTQGHEIEGWRARENEFKDREDNCLKSELAAFYSEKRVEDHQHMVGLIFRNSEIRKTTLGTELSHQPGHSELKDEYGNIRQYHEDAGFVGTPVKKDEIETKE